MDNGGIFFLKIMDPKNISVNDYDYHLPIERIALHPLTERDASKLLVYKNGIIEETVFSSIDKYVPANSLLVFNNSKVINARIKFTKPTGAVIEIFCLEPYGVINNYSSIMSATNTVQWKCLVGGAAKWKDEILQKEIDVAGEKVILHAKKIDKITEAFIVELFWEPAIFCFAEIIEAAGKVPLPPYIKRNTDADDSSRYQTIFAAHDGSVAAPTAGLHFSPTIFEKLTAKNIEKAFVTLHVGAGTFKPVKAKTMQEHEMHAEYIDVDIATIEKLKSNIGKITAVGTTSMRTLESLYWMGIKVHINPTIINPEILQWDVYESDMTAAYCSTLETLNFLTDWMNSNNKKSLFTRTQILIVPGYKFRVVNMLVTNFHQPRSTLLLLVAAAIGNDWEKMYDYAMKNDFRFLSYGDGNLLFLK